MSHTFLSIAPFRTPFSSNSELRCTENNRELLEELKALTPLAKSFEINPVEWKFGYGTARHDHIPSFFRPLAILTPTQDAPDLPVEHCEIHIYDDGIGVLFLRWSHEICERLIDDEQLWTDMTIAYFGQVVAPALETTRAELETQIKRGAFLKPSTLIVSSSITNLSQTPYWVARSILAPSPNVLHRDMAEWANYATPSSAEPILYAGSGNSFIFSEEHDRDAMLHDVYRAFSFCQFYASLVERYQLLFRSDFRILKNQKPGRISTSVKNKVEARLDHLDFVKLQYERARAGMQGRRAKLVSALLAAWSATKQLENTMGWATVLKKRLDRDLQNRQVRQGRAVRALLAFVGGVSLLDLALLLVNEAKQHQDDGVPGLLDLTARLPADMALYLAILTLAIAMFLSATRDR